MRCRVCRRGQLRMKVNIFADVSVENRKLTKVGIRSRDVRIEGVDWDRVHYCTNPSCGYLQRYKAGKRR